METPLPAAVSIVVPALHRPELTAASLDSIGKQTGLKESRQIIVVEDDARGGPMLANPEAYGAEQIRLEKNYGFAAAVNRGVERASGEFILLLNNDVELRSDYVERLLNALQRDPKAAFACGKLLQQADSSRIDG